VKSGDSDWGAFAAKLREGEQLWKRAG
jgi:hypothetical protein